MYIFNNAAKNLLRNKGRNIIVMVIILAILTVTAISMIIHTTTNSIITDYKERFGSQVYIQTDIEKFKQLETGDGPMSVVPDIPDDVKLAIAESDHLKETIFEVFYPSYAEKLTGLDQNETSSGGNVGVNPDEDSEYHDANVQVIGYSDIGAIDSFKEGKRKVTEGVLFQNNYEAIVSEDFASLNDLKVGDEIEVKSSLKSDTYKPLQLKISGIYFDITESKFGDWTSAATNPRNEILTSYETMQDYQENIANEKQIFSVSATYFLKKPGMLKTFDQEAHAKGLDDVFVMETDEHTYNQIVKPVEGLAKTSIMFTTIVLVFGSAILVLLSILSIRERKYEIGVLRAIGMKKGKLVRGIMYESLIMIVISLIIGLSIGGLTAQSVSDKLLDHQSEVIAENSQENPFNHNDSETSLAEIDVQLTFEAIAGVSIIAILLGLLSSSVGIIFIMRYEPIKILSERD